MEALRAAGRAVLRSPSLARRRRLGGACRLRRARHGKEGRESEPASQPRRPRRFCQKATRASARGRLRAPGYLSHGPRLPCRRAAGGVGREPLLEAGRDSFPLQYLGMTLVEEAQGEAVAAAAIRRIVALSTGCGPPGQGPLSHPLPVRPQARVGGSDPDSLTTGPFAAGC